MTPQDLLTRLLALPADAALVFVTPEGAIKGGYHVTEWKLHDIRSIDCGANLSAWSEAVLQLLDGSGGGHMTVGKFAAILRQSLAKLDGLGDWDMRVEFGHGNLGKRIFGLSEPIPEGDRVIITLTDQPARCKPADACRAARAKSAGAAPGADRACC